jgi:hypothetical protein
VEIRGDGRVKRREENEQSWFQNDRCDNERT